MNDNFFNDGVLVEAKCKPKERTIYQQIMYSLHKRDSDKANHLIVNFAQKIKSPEIRTLIFQLNSNNFFSKHHLEQYGWISMLKKILEKRKKFKLLFPRSFWIPDSFRLRTPIPIEIQKVCHQIHVEFKNAVLTGSAPMSQYFKNMINNETIPTNLKNIGLTAVNNTDINLYVPANPYRYIQDKRNFWDLKISEWKSLPWLRSRSLLTSETRSIISMPSPNTTNSFYHKNLSNVINTIQYRYGYTIRIKSIKDYEIGSDPSGGSKEETSSDDYLGIHKVLFFGIRRIYTLEIENSMRRRLRPFLQLVLVDAYPNPNKTWEDFITESFDIDITTGILHTRRLNCLGKLNFRSEVIDNIHKRRFEFKILNMTPFWSLYKRLIKYIKKGFFLKRIWFEETCSDWYIKYVLRYFRYISAEKQIYSLFESVNLHYHVQIVSSYIISFLDPIRKIEVENFHFNVIYSRHILDRIKQLENRTPGLLKLKIEPYEKLNISTWLEHNHRVKASVIIQRWFQRNIRLFPRKRGNILRRTYNARKIQRIWRSKRKNQVIIKIEK